MTTTLSLPYLALVRKADPGFLKERQTEVEYEFSRRRFLANPSQRGAYEPLELADDGTVIVLTEAGDPIGIEPQP